MTTCMGNSCTPGCRWWCLWWRFSAVLFPTRCLGWDLGLNWISFWGFSYLLFHYHPPIVLEWLNFCWKGRQIASHLSIYSKTSMARTPLALLPRLFWTRSWVPTKNLIASDIFKFRIIREIFVFYIDNSCCVYTFESPRRGDSNENNNTPTC